jgi:hypothetical protein
MLLPALPPSPQAAITTGHLRIILPNGYELNYGDPSHVHNVPAGTEWRRQPAPRYTEACAQQHLPAVSPSTKDKYIKTHTNAACRATVRVYNMAFFRKIVLRHDTGLGEAYMDKVGSTMQP